MGGKFPDVKTVHLITILMLAVVIVGCGNPAPATTASRLHKAKQTYVVILQTIDRLADAGRITPDQARAISKGIDYADGLFAVADMTAATGGDVDKILAELEPLIEKLATEASKHN